MVANNGVRNEIQEKKEAYKEMEKYPTEENKNEYRRLKKAAKKTIARAMKEEAVRKMSVVGRNPDKIFRLVRNIKIESTDVVGGRCLRRNDGTLNINEKDRA